MPRGRLARMLVTASLTSLRARSVFVSNRNRIVVLEIPSVMTELMWWAPVTPEMAVATVFVTRDSSSAGAAPNCATVTEMTGTSTFGMRVTGNLLKLMQPRTTIAAAITMGGRGCRIDHADMLKAMSITPYFNGPARSA